MQNSIFSIDQWQPSQFYYRDYIVQNSGSYYYSAFDQTSSSSFTNDLNNGQWNGYIFNNGIQKPYFTWKPSYDLSNDNTPRVKKIQFGDGYPQRLPDGINTLLLNYNLTFQGNLHSTTAILHFLSIRNGVESFVWLPPAPRGQLALFICEKWTDKQVFYNHYEITANFVQVPV